jgi:hypothetical protein
MEAMMTNKLPVCRYCPDKVAMICIGDDLYECPECCYEENFQDVKSAAGDPAKKLIDAGVYDAEPISETPRTDAEQFVEKSEDNPFVEAAFARQLERELADERKATSTLREINKGIMHDMVTLAEKLIEAMQERDKARECLREAIAYRDVTMSGYDLQEWIEALGDKQ